MFMTIDELIRDNRSVRRFKEHAAVARSTLLELVELARLSASAANLQPLKYLLSTEPTRNASIFPHLAWAGYLADWNGPEEGERPAAYIVILGDTTIAGDFHCDHGIAAQSMLLGAVERGLRGCIVASVRREQLRAALSIPDHLEILLVIALGEPAEQVVVETAGADRDIRYWRDDDGVHHVPKRPRGELVVGDER